VLRLFTCFATVEDAFSRGKEPKLGWNLGRISSCLGCPAYRSALAWVANNLQAEILRTGRCRNIFLRYEDLVANPTFEVNKILDQVSLPSISSDQNGIFHVPISHGIWGNPDRWSSMNRITITPDQRWVTELSAVDYAVTTTYLCTVANTVQISLC
jgi:hypothetical protein